MKTMIDSGLKNKVALVTGANNPLGIGAAIARALASQGAPVFIHYYRHEGPSGGKDRSPDHLSQPGLPLYSEQQTKTADDVVASIRASGGKAVSWEGDLREAETVDHLFQHAKEAFGQVDILVNNAAEYLADTFLPSAVTEEDAILWEGGPALTTIHAQSHDLHFAVNSRAVALLMAAFASQNIEREAGWGRIVNISADCAWGCPKEISYRASKYALESYSRSAAAELGPYGITVNVVSPGPVQSGYITSEMEGGLVQQIPLRRVGVPEDIAKAVVFFASEQAGWITGQVLFVHGGHRMALDS
jgi:3-oxoacyl-[acyl-carrier protein] reductase